MKQQGAKKLLGCHSCTYTGHKVETKSEKLKIKMKTVKFERKSKTQESVSEFPVQQSAEDTLDNSSTVDWPLTWLHVHLGSVQNVPPIRRSTLTSGRMRRRGPLQPQSLGLSVTLMPMLADRCLRTGGRVALRECDLCLRRAGRAAARPPRSRTSNSIGVFWLHCRKLQHSDGQSSVMWWVEGFQVDGDRHCWWIKV